MLESINIFLLKELYPIDTYPKKNPNFTVEIIKNILT